MALSKTTALDTASRAVGPICGSKTSWSFTTPYRDTELDGPSTDVRANSYAAAVAKRANRVAGIALVLMGYAPEDAAYLVGDQYGSAREMVNRAIARQPAPNA